MTDKQFEPGTHHPERWQNDLNPHEMEGVNDSRSQFVDQQRIMAYDIKELHERLPDFTDDELRQIPVLAEGLRLEQGAVYIDLNASSCHEFKAAGKLEAGRENWYVPKSEVDYQLWNRLIGVENPERTGAASET
jgi:hypothetical protein